MIIDNTLVFSDSQALTADAASTNIIDLKAAGKSYGAAAALYRDVGLGARIPLAIRVTEAFNNLTSMTIALQMDDNAAFGSPTTLWTTGAIALASLTLGAELPLPDVYLPEGITEEYIRLYYDITGTAPSTGKIFAGIVMARQTNR